MSNDGRFIDRFPILCTAGKRSKKDEPVSSLLKQYDSNNLAELFVKRTEEEEKRLINKHKQVKCILFEDNVKHALQPPVDSFALFEQKSMEARFYKKIPLAKTIPANTAPPYIYNEDITFGDKSVKDETLYNLILPPKKFAEVLKESQAGHDHFVVTHGDYNPSERINRGYVAPFNSKKCFGVRSNVDPSGAQVRRALQTCGLNYVFKNCVQDEVERRKKFEIGKRPDRTGGLCTISNKDDCKVYGKPVNWDKFKANYLLYNKSRCIEKDDLYRAVAHFNVLRRKIRTMGNTNFLNDVRFNVKKKWCTWEEVYEVLSPFRIRLDVNMAKVVANYFKICKNDKVNINKLINFLDRFIPLPELTQIEKFPPHDHSKLTTYREMNTDFWLCECADAGVDPAGARLHPKLPPEYGKAAMESLPEETTAKSLISPSIPTNYGLSHRDYLLPRSKDDIRTLFSKSGFVFTEDDFEECWEAAKKEWTSSGDMVSVEAFLYCFNKIKGPNKN